MDPQSTQKSERHPMKFPRRVTYCLLGAIVLASLVYRYPLEVGHELGSDTTFIHSLAGSLMTRGYATWILHPTSYLGLYALSYPSAIPFVLGDLSMVGGIPLEGATLLNGFVFAILGPLAAFAATRRAKPDDRLAIVVALLFTIAPFYVKDTTWVGSSRGFVTALVPVVFLVLFLHLRGFDVRSILILGALVLTMSTVHRMGFLALFILIAYFFAIPFHRITQRLRFILFRYENRVRYASTSATFAGFFAIFYVQFLFPGATGADVTQQYAAGVFFQGTSFPVLVVNMLVSLTGKIGLFLPLALFGLVRYAWKRPKEVRDKFLLVAVFVMIPLLSLRDYIAEFLIYLFVVLIPFAFWPASLGISRTKVGTTTAAILLVSGSLAFSWFMKDYWRDKYYTDGPIPDELYTASIYVSYLNGGNIISNEGLSAGRVAAISGRPVLPIGGASIHWFGPQQLTFGFVDENRVSVEALPITAISFYTDAIFVPVDMPNAKDDYETIFYNPLGDSRVQRTLASYNVRYLFLLNPNPNQFQSYIWRDSNFLPDVRTTAYKVYDSQLYSVWALP